MANAIEFHVSPSGDDAGDGSAQQPFATPARARDALRHLKSAGPLPAAGATVWLHGGDYRLRQPFLLEEQDSGSPGAPVTWRGAPGERPRFLGGIELAPAAWDPVEDPEVLRRLPEEARNSVRRIDLGRLGVPAIPPAPDAFKGSALPELFAGGERMPLARWPNEGWATFTEVVDRGSRSGDEVPRGGAFRYEDERPARWAVEEGVWLQGYWCWDWYEESIRVAAIDTAARRITLAAPHPYGIGFDPGYPWNDAPRRYFAFNLLSELDRPGEWHLDPRAMVLYCWPPAGFEEKEVILSLLEEPLVLLEDASHLSLEGIAFEAGRESGVAVTGGSGIRVAGCTFRNLGTDGVTVSGGVRHRVVSCDIHDVGASGIRLTGGDRRTLEPGGHEAVNNHIFRFARTRRTYAGAVHLYGVGNRAAHNLIHDAPHLAMEFTGNDHVIEFNRIHHVARETGDVGALYTGRDWTARGNLIRHNFIHDLSGPGVVGSMGVYLDDCISGATVFGNVIHKATFAMHTGGGRDNLFRNNILTASRHAFHIDARCAGVMEGHQLKAVFFERLEAVPYREPPWSERYPELAGILEDDPGFPKRNIVDRNVAVACQDWLHTPGMEPYLGLNRIEDNLVFEEFAEAGFVDADNLELQLREDSPVYERLPEFEPIPFERIGLFTDGFRRQLP